MASSSVDRNGQNPSFPGCDLCGSGSSHRLVQQDGFTVVRCDGCGHAFMSPRPSDEALARYYGSGEFRDKYENQGNWEPGNTSEWHVWAEHLRFVRLRAVFRAVPPPASVLEVGCGHGDLLATLSMHGYEVRGVEPDTAAAAIATLRVGEGRVSTTSLEHYSEHYSERVEFDAVLAFMVLEHTPSPTAFVHQVTRLLRPGGKLIVHVPNLDYLWLRTRLLGTALWQLPIHLHHFSPRSLKRLLEAAGFEVVGEFWHEYPYIPASLRARVRWRAAALSRVKHALWAATGGSLNLSTSIAMVARKGRNGA